MPPSRRLPVAVLAALVALLACGRAGAATDVADVARALERSPLYVDPAFAGAFPPDQRARVVRELRAAPEPVLVAFVPLIAGDQFDGDAGELLTVLHDRLGRDGIYVTDDRGILRVRSYGAGIDPDRVRQAADVAFYEGRLDEPVVDEIARLLDALADPGVAARAARARDEAGFGDPPPDGAAEEPEEAGGRAWLVGLASGGLALAIAGTVLVRRRRRGARYARGAPPVLPERVFAHARAARREELRADAERELLAFGEAVAATAAPTDPAAQADYQLALDAYEAAGKVLERESGIPDLAGVLVLIDRGRTALAAAGARDAGRRARGTRPVCFFDPLHGHARKSVAWLDGPTVPACTRCAAALRAGRAPDVLSDRGQPYFERHGVWARTGYGAYADDLVEEVLRERRS